MARIADSIREFLRKHDANDFKDADDFAARLLDELERAWGDSWAGRRTVARVNNASREIYEYYRLQDVSVFGGGRSPLRLRLGGADRVSIDFIGRLDHFYFSKFADNTREPMRKYFVDAYFKDGAALFGRGTVEEMDAFRRAAGDRFRNLTDRQTLTVIQTAVQRTRNWAHIGSLAQAEIELARIVATLDARTTPLCEFLDGKIVKVGVAQSAIERLNRLEPAEFALQMYGTELSKGIAKNPVDTLKKYLEEDGKTLDDEITKTGRGFPPFHPNCRTRLEGVIEGTDDDE
ncbi:MAG: hypothetical protein IPM50_02660 [Acidobacteriota bacterium]|nr:MAG: hypothetical protein IPM50_02660 [Acidobacteriota bacterium]